MWSAAISVTSCQSNPLYQRLVLTESHLDHKNIGLQRSALHHISVLYYLKGLNYRVICDDVKLTAKGILFRDLVVCFAIKFVYFSLAEYFSPVGRSVELNIARELD